MEEEQIKVFYDNLSGDYHTVYADWDKALARQAKVLDGVIQKYVSRTPRVLLDCACGIGTQAIGLAGLGYQVHASDLSPKAVERARAEAAERGVSISFGVADMQELQSKVKGSFDTVIACDNSLPHLLTEASLSSAFENILHKIKPDGLFLASIRDYDSILVEKPKSTEPNVIDLGGGARIVSFQVWDWHQDDTYTVSHFTLKREAVTSDFQTFVRTVKYRAYKREEIEGLLLEVGFEKVQWMMPEDSGYFQPIVLAFN